MLVGIQSVPASSVYVEGKLREPEFRCVFSHLQLWEKSCEKITSDEERTVME